MRAAFGPACLVLLLFGCDEAAREGAPDCEAACSGGPPCELPQGTACKFSQPSPWLMFVVSVGEEPFPLPGSSAEILAFPSAGAGQLAPVAIGGGAFSGEYLLSWSPTWSPDGGVYVFDSTNLESDVRLKNRLFFITFDDGVPAPARSIPNLPMGGYLSLGEWDAASTAFYVHSNDELYIVHREGSELVATLAAYSGVPELDVCAGGTHITYTTDAGLAIAPANILDGEPRVIAVGEHTRSPDDRWIAVVKQGEAAGKQAVHHVELLPCGDGAVEIVTDGWVVSPTVSFSPDSRYLLLSGDDRLLGYVDLQTPGKPFGTFPEGANGYEWSDDGSYVLLSMGDEPALIYWPETGESRALPFPSQAWIDSLGDYLILPRGDQKQYSPAFAVVDPTAPEQPLLEFAQDTVLMEDLVLDPSESKVAYLSADDTGSRVQVVDLRANGAVKAFEFPSDVDVQFGGFSGDGAGILVATQVPHFSVYWLPVVDSEAAAEAQLIHEGVVGELLEAQPWR